MRRFCQTSESNPCQIDDRESKIKSILFVTLLEGVGVMHAPLWYAVVGSKEGTKYLGWFVKHTMVRT